MTYRSTLVAAACAVTLSLGQLAVAQTPAPTPPAVATTISNLASVPAPAVAARAWISIDLTSNQVLAEDRPDERVEPASLTKIMTAFLVFNALKEKRLTLDQAVNVSEKAWKTPGSRMFIEPRKPVTVEELIRGMIVQSGNDASVALAEAVAGSEGAFVALMNQEAARLGMTNTNFMNSTGLPDPQHVTTVRDLALMSMRLIEEHPAEYAYYKEKSFTYNGITQPNRNRLLYIDPTVDGFKTGHTDSAGYCLVTSAQRGERRVLTVVVGTASDTARSQESLKLLNWSFQNFDSIEVFKPTQSVVDAQVWKGAASTVKLGSTTPVWVTVPRGQAGNLKSTVERTDPLLAPLTQGQQVGKIKLTLDDKPVREVPLVVLEPVQESGFFGRAVDAVRLWFK